MSAVKLMHSLFIYCKTKKACILNAGESDYKAVSDELLSEFLKNATNFIKKSARILKNSAQSMHIPPCNILLLISSTVYTIIRGLSTIY